MDRLVPSDRRAERVARCTFGLFLFGVGIALMIQAHIGAAPWDVFHTGVADRVGVGVGTVILVTGAALLVLWIPLRERIGLGTILNAVLIGLFVDLAAPWLPDPEALAPRAVLFAAGMLALAVGSGFYIGAGLGTGPRDGLMTGLARLRVAGRPVSVRVARTAIEASVLVLGALLGGSIGVGTVVFMLGIGPLVQVFLAPLAMDRAAPTVPAGVDVR